MLVEFNVQNVTSFNELQTFSMNASTSTKENFNESNVIDLNKFGISRLVKSASLFGANASGKSNFVRNIYMMKWLLLNSLSRNEDVVRVIPFFIKDDFYDIPSELEISFIQNDVLYRYGISLFEDRINEEWLYWVKNSRETLLFHREGQHIKYNRRSFSEAKDFVTKDDDGLEIIVKTKKNIPFVSVLSQFDCEISNEIIDWFKNIRILYGINENGFKRYTVELFEENEDFKAWALEVLKSFQITDVTVDDDPYDSPSKFNNIDDEDLIEARNHIESFRKRNKSKSLSVVKVSSECSKAFSFPLKLESDGTKKLIYMLGPIYDVIKNNRLLVVDEFDSKFHTLLSKYIIDLFHEKSSSLSQMIITTHDTNLLTKDLFRRDQIWFIEKNGRHESQLFSLLEYKERYTRVGNSYQKDYLSGKYGAIPLFGSIEELHEALDETE